MGQDAAGLCAMRRMAAWLALIVMLAWMTVIFVFSAQPDTESAQVSGRISYQIVESWNEVFALGQTQEQLEERALRIEFPVRKAAHMSEYAVLAVLAYVTIVLWSGSLREQAQRRQNWMLAFVIASGYACTDEFHQRFVPGRAGRITDVLIDASGAAIGLLVVSVVVHMILQRKHSTD